MSKNKYKWTKLFSAEGGHKYFRDEITGMIGVADNSGSTPDQTDDGVLWLDQKRCVCIADTDNGKTWISIPLLTEYKWGSPVKTTCTGASAKEAVEVCARFNMRLVINGERFVLVRESDAPEERNDEYEHGSNSQGYIY